MFISNDDLWNFGNIAKKPNISNAVILGSVIPKMNFYGFTKIVTGPFLNLPLYLQIESRRLNLSLDLFSTLSRPLSSSL
jgi:hypothetical protein